MKKILGAINLFAGYIAGLLGGITIMIVGHPIAKIFQSNNPLLNPSNGSDVIAVANTYIVFTTFIFVLITIVITGAGIWFSRWIGIRKDQEIKENMGDFFDALDKDGKLADRFVKELFDHKQISDKLHMLVQVRVETEIRTRTEESDSDINFSENLTD